MRSIALALIGLSLAALLTLNVFSQTHPTEQNGETIDCSLCHTCLEPTEADPCLVPCPRESNAMLPLDTKGPEIVILDELQQVQNLYVPVRFTHEDHAHMSSTVDGCEMCHHYNENSIEPAACSECHPMEILHENLAQPGLKGAYHRQCIGCHMEWDPSTTCVLCHEKNREGPLHGTATEASSVDHYPEVQMRDLIVYESEDAGDVPFHHRTHAYIYDRNCGDCHAQQDCSACHDQTVETIKPMGDISGEEMHDHCFECHIDDSCDYCHGRAHDDVFDHGKTGWPLESYHATLHCRDCHRQRGEFQALDNTCISCHEEGWNVDEFEHAVTGVSLGEIHGMLACEDCHPQSLETSDGVATLIADNLSYDCTACHEEDMLYKASQGFGES